MSNKISFFIDLIIGDNETFFDNDWFLSKGVAWDNFVEGEYINFALKGTVPEVYKDWDFDNDGELPFGNRNDGKDRVLMSNYSTGQFALPKLDIMSLAYDKKNSVMKDQREVILNQFTTEGLWNVSPYENTTETPIVQVTSGEVDSDGFYLITRVEIKQLRAKLNKQYPKLKGKSWTLVLDSESYWALAESDPVLKMQAAYLGATPGVGNVVPLQLFGFNIYEDSRTPWYVTATGRRLAFGSTVNTSLHMPSATAFVDNYTFGRAKGTLEPFAKLNDSGYQGDVLSLAMRGYVGPMSVNLQTNLKFMGAIVRTQQ